MIDISVIIVNWNVKELVLRLIRSIKEHTKGVSYEIILVDNASSDGSVAAIVAQHPDITVIANTENLGFAKGVNQGLREASGRVLLVQNPDSELLHDALTAYVRDHDTRAELSVTGAKLLNADRTVQDSVRRFPSVASQLLVGLKLHRLFRRSSVISGYLADDFDYSREQDVDQLMGASFSFRRELMDRIGMLDERFFIWFEEVDFMKRVKDAGLRVVFLPHIEILHHRGQSFGQVMSVHKQNYFSTSMMQYMEKHHGGAVGVLFWFLRPVSLMLSWAQSLILRDIEQSKLVIRSVEFLAVLEVGSWFAHAYPALSMPFMLAISAGVFVATLQSLGMGLAAIALELLVGSHGHMIGLGVHGEGGLSLRVTLFVAVMIAWMILVIRRRVSLPHVPIRIGVLIGAVLYAVLMALLFHRSFGDIAVDANAFGFMALLLPVASWIANESALKHRASTVIAVGVIWLAIKTLVLMYVFSHFGVDVIRATYTWVRDTRVGEVTRLAGPFHRVFMPSDLYLALAVVGLLFTAFRERLSRVSFLVLALMMGALIASLSRSLVLGMAVGFCFAVVSEAVRRVPLFFACAKAIWRLLLASVCGLVLVALVAKFPLPQPSGSVDLTKLFQDRYGSLNDPAVGARWALLTPLWAEIQKNPLMGYGFGKTISYESPDPFWKNAENPTGLVTSTRFEWGWLDVWLKFGLVGGVFFLAYLFLLGRGLWRLQDPKIRIVALGVFATLLAVHATTPYLNHPIGLSVLIGLEAILAAGGFGVQGLGNVSALPTHQSITNATDTSRSR